MARSLAASYRRKNLEHQDSEQEALSKTLEMEKEQRNQDMSRRLHPVSNKDFEILYNELDNWRRARSRPAPSQERNACVS